MKLEELKKMAKNIYRAVEKLEQYGFDGDVRFISECLNCGCGIGIDNLRDFNMKMSFNDDVKMDKLEIHL